MQEKEAAEVSVCPQTGTAHAWSRSLQGKVCTTGSAGGKGKTEAGLKNVGKFDINRTYQQSQPQSSTENPVLWNLLCEPLFTLSLGSQRRESVQESVLPSLHLAHLYLIPLKAS